MSRVSARPSGRCAVRIAASLDTQVKDSRPTEDSAAIRRRRVCLACGVRFTTFERVQLRELIVIKRNGRRVPFDRDKLAALGRRSRCASARSSPSGSSGWSREIVRELESLGESEITSETIGEIVMDALRELDDVAYVRFASVYRNFREAKDFEARARRTVRRGRADAPAASRANERRRRCAGRSIAALRCAVHGARAALGRRDLRQHLAQSGGRRRGRAESDGPSIVGRGWTQPGGRPHAETEALRRAGEAARGATLYVTLEPCSHHGRTPPCADAIIAAGIARVVSALEDPNPQVAGAGPCAAARGRASRSMSASAPTRRARAHAGHFRRMRDGRPHVTLKLAVSADGKIGLAGREPGARSPARRRARACT